MAILRRLISRFPVKTLGIADDPYLRRYVILDTRFGSIYLHEFIRSDIDPCLHDHPWSFISIILVGGYWEEMRIGRYDHMVYIGSDDERLELGPTCQHWRRPGSILRRPANTAHRIEVEPKSRPWSLVFVGPKSRPWGFWTARGWRPFDPANPDPCG